jgi:type II pantothenate kinase
MRVVLAANDGPALNDITIGELRPLLRQLAERDPYMTRMLAEDRIAAVGSGGDTPLIDLGEVSNECNAEAVRSDLVVLEGMGRGVESNWDQRFKCDAWRIALLKDESVVRYHRAKLFDVVCRFDPA